jgi:hypothetical protein
MIIKKQYDGLNHVSYEIAYEDNSKISVPLNPENKDYQSIQKWIAEGGEVIDNPPTE